MSENKFELRKLCAKDIFVMCKIISKIGIKEFGKCFSAPSVRGKIRSGADFSAVGLSAVVEIVGVILENLPKCEGDIYGFFADLSGMKPDEISRLGMAEFAQMTESILTKEEFKDFFTVVSKYFSKEEKRE